MDDANSSESTGRTHLYNASAALSELEDELQELSHAVDHIETAGETAREALEAAQKVSRTSSMLTVAVEELVGDVRAVDFTGLEADLDDLARRVRRVQVVLYGLSLVLLIGLTVTAAGF